MMYRIVALLCLFSVANAASKFRIIGGDSIDIKDAPYQVSVYDGIHLRHICGGSIISRNYILTAAHCASLPPQAYRIRVGSSKRMEDGEMLSVISVIKHEKYELQDGVMPVNDIALMRVMPDIDIDDKTTKIVQLADQNEKFDGQDAFLTGWGHDARGKAADQLQSLVVKVLTRETCDNYYKELFNGIRDGQICAEHEERNKDLCNGDSGGPLVVDGKQVGLVSWSGPGCAKPGRPGVYTEVAAYRDWIKKHARV